MLVTPASSRRLTCSFMTIALLSQEGKMQTRCQGSSNGYCHLSDDQQAHRIRAVHPSSRIPTTVSLPKIILTNVILKSLLQLRREEKLLIFFKKKKED